MRQLHDFGAGVGVLVLRIFLLCLLMMEAMFIYIYIYIYIYHIEGAVFTTIWCSMYKVYSLICIHIFFVCIYLAWGSLFQRRVH